MPAHVTQWAKGPLGHMGLLLSTHGPSFAFGPLALIWDYFLDFRHEIAAAAAIRYENQESSPCLKWAPDHWAQATPCSNNDWPKASH